MSLGEIKDKAIDGILDVVFSENKKYERWALLLVFIGFLIRLPGALNLDFRADDAIYASQSAGIIEAGLLSTHSHPPLFMYLNDLAYSFFGYSTFAARLFPLLAGTMSILVVFLIARRLFNSRVAFFSAFFMTFSNFLIRLTVTEHTMLTMFFAFLGIYLGLLYLDSSKLSYLIVSGAMFGLGSLSKYNSPFFIISFLVFTMYFIKNKGELIFTEKNIKYLLVFATMILFFSLPFLAFNYFVYAEKGIADFQFAKIFKPENAQNLFGGLFGQEESFLQSVFNISHYANYSTVFKTDLVLGLFALGGLGLMFFRRKWKELTFFGIFFLIPFVLQSAGNALPKHFAFMFMLFALPAGYLFSSITEIPKLNKKWIMFSLIALVLIPMIFNLGNNLHSATDYLDKSGTSGLKSYINQNVDENDLILFDSRIYTAEIFWLATDNNFLILSQFPEFANMNQEAGGGVSTKVHLVECSIDDCGWGWVHEKPEVNDSAEELLKIVRNNSQKVASFNDPIYEGNELFGEKEGVEEYGVYTFNILLNPSMVSQTKNIQSFYFAPYLYQNMGNYVFDYQVSGIKGLVDSFARGIIYLSVLLTMLILVGIVFLL